MSMAQGDFNGDGTVDFLDLTEYMFHSHPTWVAAPIRWNAGYTLPTANIWLGAGRFQWRSYC